MFTRKILAACGLVLVAVLASGCGDGGSSTSATDTSGTATTPAGLEQPAIWPAADVTFTSPEAAAADFVAQVLDVPVSLGPFREGDSRSGEIDLRFAGEGGGTAVVRSVLLMRRLGPDDGWFVIGAANENASITEPQAGAVVPDAPVTVRGRARGFEGTVIVSAFVAGEAGSELDRQLATGGSMATPKPFDVDIDLSRAQPGQTIGILVRGGTGLETDPGEVGAIPVVIGG